MDLYHDMAEISRRELARFGSFPDASATDEQVIRGLLNVLLKLIPQRPRAIRKSDAMLTVQLPQDMASSLQRIEHLIEVGGDLNPFLSKGVLGPDEPDFLFFDWAIYHLHLSQKKKEATDFFMKRSPKLLFAIIADSVAYMVDVRKHGEENVFAKKELLEVVARNWPDLLEPYRLRGIMALEHSTSDEDLKKLREAGINVIQDIGCGIYASMGGGITTARTSIRVTQEHDRLARRFWQIEKDMAERGEEIKQTILSQGLAPPESVDFSLLGLNETGCVLEEKATRFILQYQFGRPAL